MGKKRTHEQFIEEVKQLTNDEYKVCGEYVNARTKIQMKHIICDRIWLVTPSNFLHGNKCGYCYGTHKKTTNEFKKEISDITNGEYELISEYINSKSKIKIKHIKCGREYFTTPSDFLRGGRCKSCSRIKKTHLDFVEDMYKEVKDEYSILSDYKGTNKKIQLRHNICGHIYDITPDSFLGKRKTRCPQCCGNLKKTQEKFEKEILNLIGDEYSVLGTYMNADTKIKFRHNCNDCNNHEWEVKPVNFISNNSRCPICNESKGEKKISQYLMDDNIEFIPQKEFNDLLGLSNGNLSYDFYLPQYNLLIEYQGEFHDGSGGKYTKIKLIKQQEHDKRKKEYANNHNIKLLEIWYYDFDNIETILSQELNILKLIKQVV